MAWHLGCYNAAHAKPAKRGFPAKFPGKCEMANCILWGGEIKPGDEITWTRRWTSEPSKRNASNSNGATPAMTIANPPNPEASEPDSSVDVGTEGPTLVTAGIEAIVKPIVEAELAARLGNLDTSQVMSDMAAKLDEKLASLRPVTTIEVKLPTGETIDCGVQHTQFPTLLAAISARVNIWLAGPAGSGKTTAAREAAKALGLPYYDTGAISDPYALFGFRNAHGEYVRTLFREAYENGGVFLQDEVDASDPNAVLALNAALANGHASFPDKVVTRHADCVIIAAANTWGHGASHDYVGRLKADGAFLDRFAFIGWDYDESLESATSPNPTWTRRVQNIRRRIRERGIKVLCTPRATYMGASLLAAGLTQDVVERMTIRKGMTDDQWASIS